MRSSLTGKTVGLSNIAIYRLGSWFFLIALNVCLTGMFCVNLIVLQKHVFSFVDHTNWQHFCTTARNLSFKQPSVCPLEKLWRTPGVCVPQVGNGWFKVWFSQQTAFHCLTQYSLFQVIQVIIEHSSTRWSHLQRLTWRAPMIRQKQHGCCSRSWCS